MQVFDLTKIRNAIERVELALRNHVDGEGVRPTHVVVNGDELSVVAVVNPSTAKGPIVVAGVKAEKQV